MLHIYVCVCVCCSLINDARLSMNRARGTTYQCAVKIRARRLIRVKSNRAAAAARDESFKVMKFFVAHTFSQDDY